MRDPYLDLEIEAGVWLVTVVGCGVATLLSRQAPPKCPALSLILALLALVVGALGLWTPFSFLPRLGYSWIDRDERFHFYIEVNQFFVVPLVLGTLLSLLALWRRWRVEPGANCRAWGF
jgi:hypothetical protein